MNVVGYFDWSLLWELKWDFLHGLLTAAKVAVVGIVLASALGLLLAKVRMGRTPASWIAAAYINIARGLPALVTLVWVYYGFSLLLGINFSVFQAGVITLTVLYSAYIAEIYRAALLAIPRGQREAGVALGMHPVRVFVQVTLPQATKIALPNIGSMFIGMIKDTSVMSVIGLLEVLRVAENSIATNYQYFVLFTAAALTYIIATFVFDFVFRTIEKSVTKPPAGRLAKALDARRRRRIENVVRQVEALSGKA